LKSLFDILLSLEACLFLGVGVGSRGSMKHKSMSAHGRKRPVRVDPKSSILGIEGSEDEGLIEIEVEEEDEMRRKRRL
jgi:hypothetical protein